MRAEPAVLFGSTSDTPTPIDTLGFKPYVESVAKFLESPNTQPPLTISIEGEWGSGKSSFMWQLKDQLCANSSDRVAVEFNAWRHDKDDSLWAAFALKCTRDLRLSLRRRHQIVGWLRLNVARLHGYKGWAHLARLLVLTMLWLCLLLAGPTAAVLKGMAWTKHALMLLQPPQKTPTGDSQKPDTPHPVSQAIVWLIVNGSFLGLWAATVIVGGSQLKKLGNPLETDLEKIVSTPGYEGKIEFIDQFHEDFKKILDAYVGNRRVYVFVDDLDRCDVPKAADLMRALNLMIDGDKRIVFIIGMDRDKVAAGIAAKYSTILQYVDDDRDGPPQKLAFGYHFLEKFIQIQYRLPQPRLTNVRALIGGVRRASTLTAAASSLTPDGEYLTRKSNDDAPTAKTIDTETKKSDPLSIERRAVEVLLDRDGETVFTATEMVAPAFNFNPRRIKQFLNLFRLSVFIANGLGLFDEIGDRPVMTFQQLAKFIAISMIWPSFIQRLEADKSLLGKLYRPSESGPSAQDEYISWLKITRFKNLIDYGSHESDGNFAPDAEDFSLEHLDIEPLLAVTAPIIRVRAGTPNSPQDQPISSQVKATDRTVDFLEQEVLNPQPLPERERVPVEVRLDELARSYEVTRDSMDPSDERTAAMSAVVRSSRGLAKQIKDTLLPLRLFTDAGKPGDRVVALGLAQALMPSSEYLPITLEGIMRAKSAFEQYHALNLASRILDRLDPDQKLDLKSALLKQEGVPIDKSDSSRWLLREKLLREIESQGT
jgi:KAP family P-loop domain